MENRQPEQTSHSFEFINITGGSGRERRRNNYLARAHAAKINRQNYKGQANSRRSKNVHTFFILPKDLRGDLVVKESSIEDGTSSEDGADQGRSLKVCRVATPSREAPTETLESSEQWSTAALEIVPSPRSISPAYGAISIDTFDWNSQPISAQVGHYCECCRVTASAKRQLMCGVSVKGLMASPQWYRDHSCLVGRVLPITNNLSCLSSRLCCPSGSSGGRMFMEF
jgi:hypothetical protein